MDEDEAGPPGGEIEQKWPINRSTFTISQPGTIFPVAVLEPRDPRDQTPARNYLVLVYRSADEVTEMYEGRRTDTTMLLKLEVQLDTRAMSS